MSDPTTAVFGFSFDSPPDHVNEEGVKWWLDRSLTQYARRKGLKGMTVYGVEHLNGRRTRLLVEDGVPIEEDMGYEGMACRIDKHVTARTFSAYEKGD